ncbi:MAG: hypothetical protein ABSA80_20525 [Terriglobales bacterium]
MDYKENRTRANLAEGDVAVLFFFSNFAAVGKVSNGHGIGIVEHKLGRLEIDIVLRQISLALSLVALETHTAITFKDNNCTYSCQYSPGTCFICGQMA